MSVPVVAAALAGLVGDALGQQVGAFSSSQWSTKSSSHSWPQAVTPSETSSTTSLGESSCR